MPLKFNFRLVLMGIYSDKPSEMEGFPMKSWNIEVFLVDEQGNDRPATCFTKVTYNLHPSFANPIQSKLINFSFVRIQANDSAPSLHISAFPLRE